MSAGCDAVVVGGGLAGAAVALSLARAGRPITLFEKSKGPHHKVCGEFLSYEALHYLRGLGIDVQALGPCPSAVSASLGSIVRQKRCCRFRRSRFREPASMNNCSPVRLSRGVHVLRDHHVEGITASSTGWQIAVRERGSFHAGAIFLASGKHDVRTWSRPPGTQTGLVGFKMHFRLCEKQQAALSDAVELVPFPGGYAGLQTIENGAANLCLLITAKVLRTLGGGWPALQQHLQAASTHLASRLAGAAPLFAAPLTVASIPYGFVQSRGDDGLWRVGDQAAVIPSFSGDGMAIALHSGVLAAQRYVEGESPQAFQGALASHLRRRLFWATKLSQTLVSLPGLAELVCFCPSLLPRIALMTRIHPEALLPMEAATRA